MNDAIISVEALGKRYRIRHEKGGRSYNTFRDALASTLSAPFRSRRRNGHAPIPSTENFWALKDVSFEVKQGEVLGIIGRNGAGKSTLLKILSRITEPTEGRVTLRGRVASLLEVGTGFHPELTGRENIFLNGAILGMSRREIVTKFDEIVAFAEVEKFLDTPVKRYSSGMYVRLAFAVAAHLEPEVLIVDEVLAVGDVQFQKKCLGKMRDVSSGEGRTVFFVSHSMAAIQSLCSRVLLLEEGGIICDAQAPTCIQAYSQVNRPRLDGRWAREKTGNRAHLVFEHMSLDLRGRQPNIHLHIQTLLLKHSGHKPAFVAFDILDSLGVPIMQALPTLTGFLTDQHAKHELEIDIQLGPLIPGRYGVTGWVGPHNTTTYDHVDNVLSFTIESSPTPDRAFPHHSTHGHIVPVTKLVQHSRWP